MTTLEHRGRTHKKLVVLDELQSIEFEGLLLLRDIIESLGLAYYLAYGTLLGAARHGGFIPWDDDIDILMPRGDYELLLDAASAICARDWELLSYRNKQGYLLPWAKFCNTKTVVEPSRFVTGLKYGCSIDVFPLDSVEARTEAEAVSYHESFYLAYKRAKLRYQPIGVLTAKPGRYAKLLAKRLLFGTATLLHGSWQNQLAELDAKAKRDDSSKYVMYLYDPIACVWQRDLFEAPNGERRFLTFEGASFRVPFCWDDVLRIGYGNYMELPPEKERTIKHGYTGIYMREEQGSVSSLRPW